MPWRHIARALVVPAACFALNVFVFVWGHLPARASSPFWHQLSTAALILAIACASVLAVLPAGVALMLLIGRYARSGRLNPFKACRVSYHLAMELAWFLGVVSSAAYLTTAGAWGFAPPLLLVGLVAGWVAAMFVLGVRLTVGLGVLLTFVLWDAFGDTAILRTIAPPLWLLAVLAAGAANALRTPRLAVEREDQEPIRVTGRVIPFDRVPSLRALLDSIAASPAMPTPRNLVVGLGAGISYQPRNVLVDDELLEGGTLYLSLPMCRVLDRGELAGLVVLDLAYAELVPAAWARFIQQARADVSRFLQHRLPGRVLDHALAASRVPLEQWAEMWGSFDAAAWLHCAGRGGVVAGRETMVSALSKAMLFPPAWGAFIPQLRAQVREATDGLGGDENISRQLADRLLHLHEEPGFLHCLKTPGALASEHSLLAAAAAHLGVEPAAVTSRLQTAPTDPAIGLIDGAEAIELDLSVEARKEFLPEWPRVVSTSEGTAAAAPPPAKVYLHRLTSPEEKPYAVREGMFTLSHKDRSLEGIILGAAGVIFVLLLVGMAGEPLVYRFFPEVGATKTGPAGFPVTVHIGIDDVAFTNGSAESWNCRAELGFPHVGRSYALSLSLEPQQTLSLSYRAFRGSDTDVAVSEVRDAARGKGTFECADAAGRSHYWGW